MHKDGIYLYGFTKGAKMRLAMKGVTKAHEWHAGQLRDDKTPYVEHVLKVCRSLINLNNPEIITDVVACAALLHDSVEDKKTTLGNMEKEFGPEVAFLVDQVTKREEETKEEYFKRITDPRAILIKGEDRRWNITTMVTLAQQIRNIDRLEKYIEETESKILPMLKEARRNYLEYSDAFVSIRDNLNDIINAARIFIEEFKRGEELEKKVSDKEGETR